MANNKGRKVSDEQLGKAAGGYIIAGGIAGDDRVFNSKGKFLASIYDGKEAKGFARGADESDMYITEDELKQLQTKGYFTRGNKKYHDNTVEYL